MGPKRPGLVGVLNSWPRTANPSRFCFYVTLLVYCVDYPSRYPLLYFAFTWLAHWLAVFTLLGKTGAAAAAAAAASASGVVLLQLQTKGLAIRENNGDQRPVAD